MRRFLVVLAFLLSLAPSSLTAQGRIIPRPCCAPPPPCRDDRCPRPLPCPAVRCDVMPGQAVRRASSDVRVELVDRVLRYEVDEIFVNDGGALGEADYLFPLPHGAAFQELQLSVNGELVAGETLPADEARRIYEEIVRRQRDPALVEWMGHGLLRARIFPIAPGERKRVVVRFQMVAPREGDAIRVDHSGGSAPAGQRREERASFVLSYPDIARYGTPYSPTHSLDVNDRGTRRVVTVRDPSRTVTVLLPVRSGSQPAISVLAHATGGREDGFALVTLTPPAMPPRRTPRDVTFVVDVSGSMSGRKMEQARAAGKQLLETLSPDDRFRIVDFSTDVRTFRDGWTDATRENLRAAVRYLDDLRPVGSTNISGAMREALGASTPPSRLPVVLFVTDGEPTVGERDPEAIARDAASRRGRARVFTFGLGADVNVPLVERLALEAGGTAQFVRPEEDVERMVAITAARLAAPVLTDVRLRADGVRLVRMHPAGEMDLFAGQDLVVLTRYEGHGEATLRFEGRSANGPVSWTQTVNLPERDRGNEFVPRLWATQRVGWLAAEKRRNGASRELDEEIRALGERYGIPTEFTSYFVREPDMVATGRGQGGVGGAATGNLQGRVRRTAPTSGAVPPPAVSAPREEAFAAAKVAAEQRQSTSLAAADAASVSADTRRVGDRLFALRDNVWTDLRADAPARTVRVKAYSEAWFRLAERIPALREAFALGDRVQVSGTRVAIVTAEDGVERLSGAELDAIVRDW